MFFSLLYFEGGDQVSKGLWCLFPDWQGTSLLGAKVSAEAGKKHGSYKPGIILPESAQIFPRAGVQSLIQEKRGPLPQTEASASEVSKAQQVICISGKRKNSTKQKNPNTKASAYNF